MAALYVDPNRNIALKAKKVSKYISLTVPSNLGMKSTVILLPLLLATGSTCTPAFAYLTSPTLNHKFKPSLQLNMSSPCLLDSSSKSEEQTPQYRFSGNRS